MKSVFDTQAGSEYTRTVRRLSRIMIVSFLAAIFVVAMLPQQAWSFENYYGRLNDRIADPSPKAQVTSHPAAAMPEATKNSILADSTQKGAADSCLPLLSSMRHAPSRSAMDRNQRDAGKAAALGLIFGVRFALQPSKTSNNSDASDARLGFWQPDTPQVGAKDDHNRSALAVVAYRQCQKEQALQALNDFRWTR